MIDGIQEEDEDQIDYMKRYFFEKEKTSSHTKENKIKL